jgi:hypothetical protein
MQLMLEKNKWTEIERDQAAGAPLPHIVLFPSEPKLTEPRQWKKSVLEWNLAPGATLVILSDEPSKSSVEWPGSTVEARVMRAGDVVEARLLVVYHVLESVAAVMWRGPLATPDADRARITKALQSGRPDWRRREIIAIYQLWE